MTEQTMEGTLSSASLFGGAFLPNPSSSLKKMLPEICDFPPLRQRVINMIPNAGDAAFKPLVVTRAMDAVTGGYRREGVFPFMKLPAGKCEALKPILSIVGDQLAATSHSVSYSEISDFYMECSKLLANCILANARYHERLMLK
jgi:hypothetical protein